MGKTLRYEDPKNRNHVYRMRLKRGGWYGRRFGKNPRHANRASDAYRNERRSLKS